MRARFEEKRMAWVEELRTYEGDMLTKCCYRGQYSDAVLNELESQNDEQVSGILGKVRQLKGVSVLLVDLLLPSLPLSLLAPL